MGIIMFLLTHKPAPAHSPTQEGGVALELSLVGHTAAPAGRATCRVPRQLSLMVAGPLVRLRFDP